MASGDIRSSSLKKPIDTVEYLYRRLHEVGIRSVHGVPGDYNLVALDYLKPAGLNWVGNCNELNAGYSADGYARIKGISALVTTFGVGELSALNAIAGAYAEYVPIVHIVGMPSTSSQANGMLLHHTLGNGDFNVFVNMSRNISCDMAVLTSPDNAAALIDNAIRECYIQSRPVYIGLPTDMVNKKIEGARLNQPIDLAYPDNDPGQEDYVVSAIMNHLHEAKRPTILVDACTIRHRATTEVHDFVVKSGLPTFSTPMGKGAIDETLPNYVGVYAGSGSHGDVRKLIESSDLVLSIGAIKSDFNTTGFTYHLSDLTTIDFHSYMVKVKYSEYNGCRMNGVLKKLTRALDKAKLSVEHPSKLPSADVKPAGEGETQAITHEWFWPHLTPWIRENDIIITETGTSGYGIWEVRFKRGVQGISQILWGSIGYAFGALQGTALAARETGKERTILFTGDGSFQLTAQELSTISRLGLSPVIFVICNQGYTIERFIHGMDASYNDVAEWKYKDLIATLGARPGSFETYQVRTRDEALALLRDPAFAHSDKLRFVELYMPKDDAPQALQMTAKASAENNAKQ